MILKPGWRVPRAVMKGVAERARAAIKGAVAGGAAVTPGAGGAGAVPGGLGRGVLGFVGGFMKGLLEASIKTAGEGAWDCVK
jgi:hypothetical protein